MYIVYLLSTKRAIRCSLTALFCLAAFSSGISQTNLEPDDPTVEPDDPTIEQDNPAIEQDNPVMEFYIETASTAYETCHALLHGVRFSFDARTFYKYIDKKGRVTSIDSAIGTYYYSFGELDSVVNDTFYSKAVPEFDLDYPDIFSEDYIFNFFPNDTGGPELALGFDTDSIGDKRPVGLVVLNRPIYDMSRLYLHYPGHKDHKYFSRVFRFINLEGFQFPDSIWEVGASRGFVSSRYFRLETGITNITIYP